VRSWTGFGAEEVEELRSAYLTVARFRGYESAKDLTGEQYGELADWVEGQMRDGVDFLAGDAGA
jgi:hypothetical protein